MPISDRDYMRGSHPPNCTCKECTNKRLARIRRSQNKLRFIKNRKTSDKPDSITPSNSPADKVKRLDYQISREIIPSKGGVKLVQYNIPGWLLMILCIFISFLIGLVISIYAGSYIPLWILLGLSLILSIEKWFFYLTRRYTAIGRLYKSHLNVFIILIV